jgi:hypothetical protein
MFGSRRFVPQQRGPNAGTQECVRHECVRHDWDDAANEGFESLIEN